MIDTGKDIPGRYAGKGTSGKDKDTDFCILHLTHTLTRHTRTHHGGFAYLCLVKKNYIQVYYIIIFLFVTLNVTGRCGLLPLLDNNYNNYNNRNNRNNNDSKKQRQRVNGDNESMTTTECRDQRSVRRGLGIKMQTHLDPQVRFFVFFLSIFFYTNSCY